MNDDRGSATVWVLACIGLIVLMATAASFRSAAVLARHHTEAAADLAALAAATQFGTAGDPCSRARDVAARNGAELDECRVEAGSSGRVASVRVWVSRELHLPGLGVRRIVARARAARLTSQ